MQENGPERLEIKHELFARLDEAAPPGTVLASGSSGLLPSAIAKACPKASRAGGHRAPVNPAHMIPLVEVVQGEVTSAEAVERGAARVSDIDAAISHGPGLRWAVLGPLANQHLSGGAGGCATC